VRKSETNYSCHNGVIRWDCEQPGYIKFHNTFNSAYDLGVYLYLRTLVIPALCQGQNFNDQRF